MQFEIRKGAALTAQAPSFPPEITTACEAVDATLLISVPVRYRAMRETGVYCRRLHAAYSSAGPLDAIDAEEIRERIRSFAGVGDAFVAALAAGTGRGTELGALVEGDVNPSALRCHLIGRLPPHAVARRIRTVEKIPVTATGKFDRAAAVDLLIR